MNDYVVNDVIHDNIDDIGGGDKEEIEKEEELVSIDDDDESRPFVKDDGGETLSGDSEMDDNNNNNDDKDNDNDDDDDYDGGETFKDDIYSLLVYFSIRLSELLVPQRRGRETDPGPNNVHAKRRDFCYKG